MPGEFQQVTTDLQALREAAAAKQAEFEAKDLGPLTLNQANLLVVSHKLDQVKLDYLTQMAEYQERREEVQLYTMTLQLINRHSTDEGLVLPPADEEKDTGEVNLRGMLVQLQERGCPLTIKDRYEAKERDGLIENVKRGLDDLNHRNNITLEKAHQNVTERFEALQYARAIVKPGHEATQQMARNIAK